MGDIDNRPQIVDNRRQIVTSLRSLATSPGAARIPTTLISADSQRGASIRIAINFVAFQIGWFSTILGVAHGRPWLGFLTVPLVLLAAMLLAVDWRQELILGLAAAIFGFSFDTTLSALDVFKPAPFLLPSPLSPLWMSVLWVNQATTLNSCMGWLRRRYLIGSVFGAIGGPLAYFGGAKLGAASVPSTENLAVIGMAWAIGFPALLAMAEFVRSRFGRTMGGNRNVSLH